jgi:hypothetical protein
MNGPSRQMGFLIFHWYAIRNFVRSGCPTLWGGGIRAFTLADFRSWTWPYIVTAQAQQNDIDSLVNFSQEIQDWHNRFHDIVTQITQAPFGDPTVNIYYREFWRLHYFINNQFLRQLSRYDGVGTPVQRIRRLEQAQHSRVVDV